MLHDKSSEYDTGGFCFLKGSYHKESNLPWSIEIKELSVLWKHAVTFRTQIFLPSEKKQNKKKQFHVFTLTDKESDKEYKYLACCPGESSEFNILAQTQSTSPCIQGRV